MATSKEQKGLRFNDKVVLVTGGCNGIGKACVDVFLENGAKVVIFDVDEQTGSNLAAEPPEDLFFIKCDVSKEDEVKRSVESAIDKFGKIDCLINNAGLYALFGEIDSIPLQDFQKIIGINLLGCFIVSKHTLPHLRQTKGNIVNMASIGGHHGFHGSLAYCTTKGGVLAMTKALAIDEAKNGVRVNSVSPGPIWTSLLEKYHKQVNDEQLLNNMKGFTLLKRFGVPREVAQTCFFLACEGTYCTGVDIVVSGGTDVGLGVKDVNL